MNWPSRTLGATFTTISKASRSLCTRTCSPSLMPRAAAFVKLALVARRGDSVRFAPLSGTC
jgi:hypothetical protein